MTHKQLAILNSLVTFAAENIPGGLKDDEREVAQIVGEAVLQGSPVGYKIGTQIYKPDDVEVIYAYAKSETLPPSEGDQGRF